TGEFVMDKTLAQFMPGSADKERIGTRAVLNMAQGLARELVDATNDRFNDSERKAVMDALPSTGYIESYPDAQKKLEIAKMVLSNRGRVYSRATNQAAPLYALGESELKSRYRLAKTDEERNAVLDAIFRFHPEIIAQLKGK